MIYRLALLLLRLVRPWQRHCLVDEHFAEMPTAEAVLRLDQLVEKLDAPSANELLTRYSNTRAMHTWRKPVSA